MCGRNPDILLGERILIDPRSMEGKGQGILPFDDQHYASVLCHYYPQLRHVDENGIDEYFCAAGPSVLVRGGDGERVRRRNVQYISAAAVFQDDPQRTG